MVSIFVFFVLFFFFLVFFFSDILNQKMLCKVSSFDCGFDSLGVIQLSFSIQFFFVLLVFVIFDVELVVFIVFIIVDFNHLFGFFFCFFFVFFSYYLEICLKSLHWFI